MATRRTQRLRRKKSNLGPVIFAVFAMALGGGGSFLVITKHKEKNAEVQAHNAALAKKKADEQAMLRKRDADRKAKTDALRAAREKKKKEIEEARAASAGDRAAMARINGVKAALPDLMADAQYAKALALINEAESQTLSASGQAEISALKNQVIEKAKENLAAVRVKALQMAKNGDIEGAIELVQGTETFGLDEIAEEADTLIEELKSRQDSIESAGLAPQIAAYQAINDALSSALRDADYDRAQELVNRMAGQARYATFAKELNAMKGDFAAVRALWIDCVKKMASTPGKQVQFGIKIGEIVKEQDGALVIANKGEEEILDLKDMQPKWLENQLALDWAKSPPENWLAIGLFNLHKGRDSQARAIFVRLKDALPAAQTKLDWLEWDSEIKAKELFDEINEAAQNESHSTVVKKAAELREQYPNTRFFEQEKANLATLEAKSGQAREEAKGEIGDKLAALEEVHEAAMASYNQWVEDTQSEIEKKLEDDLTDPVTYRRYGDGTVSDISSTSRLSSYTIDGHTYKSGYGYYVYRQPVSKEANLKTVRDLLSNKESYGSPYTKEQKKDLEKEVKRLGSQLRSARTRAQSNVNRFKTLRVRKKDAIKNTYIRMQRKLKEGEELSDSEMRDAFK